MRGMAVVKGVLTLQRDLPAREAVLYFAPLTWPVCKGEAFGLDRFVVRPGQWPNASPLQTVPAGAKVNLRTKTAIILLVCLALRLLFFALVQPWTPLVEEQILLQRDALGYHQLASTLLDSGRFAYTPTGEPEALRTPLYPMFVAGTYAVFGREPWVALLFQIVLDALACFLLLKALARLFGDRVAILASLFYALDPFLILYCSTLLSDTLFVFFVVAAFLALSGAATAESPRKSAMGYGASGLLLGLATLVRPIAEFAAAIFVAFIIFKHWRHLKRGVAYAAVALAVFALTLAPWLVRNGSVFGAYSLSTSGPYNLLILNVVPMEMTERGQSAGEVRAALMAEAGEVMARDGFQPGDLTPFEQAGYWQKLALRYVRAKPLQFGQTYLLGILHTFANLDTSGYAQMLRLPVGRLDIKAYTNLLDLAKAFLQQKGAAGLLIAVLIAPYLLSTYLGAAVGLFAAWKRHDRWFLTLCLLITLYFVAATGAGGLARFKLPAIPFYLPFTAIGLLWLRDRAELSHHRGHREHRGSNINHQDTKTQSI